MQLDTQPVMDIGVYLTALPMATFLWDPETAHQIWPLSMEVVLGMMLERMHPGPVWPRQLLLV